MTDFKRLRNYSAEIKEQAGEQNGKVVLELPELTDDGVDSFVHDLTLFSELESSPRLKGLWIYYAKFTNEGLAKIAKALSLFKETLEVLNMLDLSNVTSIEPLVEAGELPVLTDLGLQTMSLDGELMSPKLASQLPKLQEFGLSFVNNRTSKENALTLKESALRSLPLECRILLTDSPVTIEWNTGEKSRIGERFSYDNSVKRLLDLKQGPPRSKGRVCGSCLSTEANYFCAACKIEMYCGKSCQRTHWKKHALVCDKS